MPHVHLNNIRWIIFESRTIKTHSESTYLSTKDPTAHREIYNVEGASRVSSPRAAGCR